MVEDECITRTKITLKRAQAFDNQGELCVSQMNLESIMRRLGTRTDGK